MKIRARNTLLSLLSLLWVTSAIAQEDCKDDINYSVSNFTVQGGDRSYLRNNRSVIQATIGQHATGVTGGYSNGIEAEFGFWGHYFLEPQAPRSSASEGEYVDRIEVQWEVVNDYKGPIVTENVTQIFRNGRLITTVPLKQTTYVDYNVFPGEFYTYEIITSNNLGDSKPMKAVGFLNPNGRVTGKVETRNGTPVADVKVVLTPNLGQSLDFDGVNDYVYFVDQAYQFNKYYTVEGWWRNVEVKNQTIFVAVDSGTTNILVKISLDDQGRIRYFHDGNADGTGIELISKNGYNLDVLTRDWHHFAAVYDTANVYLYVDGNRVAEAVPEQPITTVAELEFAKDGPKQYSGYFNGFMDDFRVWNIGRERAELRKYKDITLTGEEAYLKNYWKFDEQFSNKVFDFAKKPVPDRDNGYICDVTRSSFISPAQLGAYTDAGGDYLIKGIFYGNGQTFSAAPSKATPIGYSLDFDGTDDYVSYQLDRVTYDQAFTLEGWFKTGVSGKEMVIFEASNPEDTYQFIQLGIQTTGEFYANVGFGGATSTITSANAVNDEFWYHYALVHDGTTATLYIDGVSEGTTANAGVAEITRSVIGRSGTSENNAGAKYFQGSIDEMRLWNYARTSNQVNATLNQIIPGNEQGIVDTDGTLGVDAYWMFGEGGGSIISDQTPNGHAGELMNFQEITLGSGDKLVANWNGDDLPLDVEFFNHDFDPNARNVSLDPSNTSVDRVDFTDISQIAISGFVRFANTDCFAPNVEMTINGGSFLPPVYTNADGKFTVELEPGTTNAFLASKYEDFAFNPGFIELPRLVRPIAGLRFETNTVRQIKGIVGGGECLIPLGTANVLVQSANGCFEKTVAVDVNTGEFIAEDLPPLNYQVSIVGHENTSTVQSFFNLQGAVTVDLTKKNDSISFIYTSATNIKLAFDNPEPNTCGYQVDSETATFLNQNSEYDLGIKLYQLYKSDTCFLASGSVSIDDQISDFSPSAVVDVVNGLGTYTLLAGVPNLAAPYKKTITVFGTEQANGAVLPATLASTIVFGFKTLQSTFETTTPQLPLMILRDPPGDMSYAYLEQNIETCNSFSFDFSTTASLGGFATVHGGPDLSIITGIGVAKKTDVDITADFTFEGSASLGFGTTLAHEICLASTEIFRTSANEFIAGDEGDVYVGGAFNVLVGTNRVLEIDPTTCLPVLEDVLMIMPTSFATTYIYTDAFIRGSVIPGLSALNDAESVSQWESILTYNQTLKDEALFVENVSFSAGVDYEKSVTSTESNSSSMALSSGFVASLSAVQGIQVDGVGFTAGISASIAAETNIAKTSNKSESKTIGYVFGDDDIGDNFTVDIKSDAAGMPVFNLVAGESICPWEPGTQNRAAVGITMSTPNVANNVAEYDLASFQLTLSNTSETGEDQFYGLRVLQESNPNGAAIVINGDGSAVELFVRANKSEIVTITVEKGPDAYVYTDLELELYVPCEQDRAVALGLDVADIIANDPGRSEFFARQKISVDFVKTCQQPIIFTPGNGWLVNESSANMQRVALSNIDLGQIEFDRFRFQYRRQIEGEPFVNGAIIERAQIVGLDSYEFDWDVTNVQDGLYELRAISECAGDFQPGISELVTGRIDRQAPTVLGTPTPIDAVLSADDEITITFEENVKCEDIISLATAVSLQPGSTNHVNLINTENSLSLAKTVTCEGNKLIIVPNIQNKFIEGQVLRVDLLGIKDLFGNVQTAPITWEFTVQRNPLVWTGGDVQSVTYEGESPRFIRSVKNNGAFAVNVNLSGVLDVQTLDETLLPSWLTASPRSFTLQPGGTQDVTFTVSDQIGGGDYISTVTAATSFGAPELRFDVRVLCPDPAWNINPAEFENSMNFTGQLDIRGTMSIDEYDIVAAYVGNELRGVGHVSYAPELENIPGEHPYLVFLTLYTNSTASETIDFQVWDASRCQLYGQIAESYNISINTVALGSPTSPMTVTVTNDIIQEVPLSAGWNWFSYNLFGASTATNNLLGSLDNNRGDLVKSQTDFSQYVPGLGWVGPLTKMDSTKSFRIKLTKADTLILVGEPIDFETTFVQLDSGWNWVSFLPPVGMELNEALGGITATADFIIKSQRNFAQYVDFHGWIGSLDFLRPNEGYLLYTDRPATLAFPVNANNARTVIPDEVIAKLPDGWSLSPEDFEFNSNIIMTATGLDVAEGDVIGLFDDETLVGFGEARYIDFMDEYYFFITGYTNTVLNGLSIRMYTADGEITATNELSLELDKVIGSVQEPVVAVFESEALNIAPATLTAVDIYPNPFENISTLSIQLEKGAYTVVTIHNLTGQVIYQLFDGELAAGTHAFTINKNSPQTKLSAGLYLVQVRTEEEIKTLKIIAK